MFATAVFLVLAAIVIGVLIRYWPSNPGNGHAPAADKAIAVPPLAVGNEKKNPGNVGIGIA